MTDVRAVLIATAATVALALLMGAPAAMAKAPSARQLQRAVTDAERSSHLWATINECSSRGPGRGGSVGVRGQMPALAFTSTLRMRVQLRFWSAQRKRYEPLRGSTASSHLWLGPSASGLQQDGVLFGFTHSPELLSASIDFTWTRAGRVLGQTSRVTTSGHRDADYGRPAHYSAANCHLS